MPRDLRQTLQRVQPFFVVLALILFAILLRRQWNELGAYEWRLRPAWLLLSGLCIVAGWLIEIRIWQQLIALLQQRLPYWRAVSVWFASAIVRYLPGNIWQPLSLTARCQAQGVRPGVTLASLSLYHVVHILAVVPIAALFVAGRGSVPIAGAISIGWVPVLLAPLVYLIARPTILLSAANKLLTVAGREPLPVALGTGDLLRLLGISLAAWVCFAGGFTAVTLAILPDDAVPRAALLRVLAAYPLAFAVGFAALIAPSGLAVREGMLYALLAPAIGATNALVAALGMRVWEMLLDIVSSVIALARESSAKRRVKPPVGP